MEEKVDIENIEMVTVEVDDVGSEAVAGSHKILASQFQYLICFQTNWKWLWLTFMRFLKLNYTTMAVQ